MKQEYNEGAQASSSKLNLTGAAAEVPNFTQTPNSFFDCLLPQINSMSELKVTLSIIRQTFGWTAKGGGRKLEDQLSLSRLVALTGMARTSVCDGIAAGMKRGTIERRKKGAQDFVYRLNLAAAPAKITKPVQNLDQSSIATSPESGLLTGSDSEPVLVQNLDTQKKGEIKGKKGEGADALPPPSPVLSTAETVRKPSQHPAVLIFKEVHRRYPSSKVREGREQSDMEAIIDAVGNKQDDLVTWKEALETYRDLALLHNQNLRAGQKAWNPAGIDAAVSQFAEMAAERDFAKRTGSDAAPETTSDGLVRVEVGGTTFYVQPQQAQAGGAQ